MKNITFNDRLRALGMEPDKMSGATIKRYRERVPSAFKDPATGVWLCPEDAEVPVYRLAPGVTESLESSEGLKNRQERVRIAMEIRLAVDSFLRDQRDPKALGKLRVALDKGRTRLGGGE